MALIEAPVRLRCEYLENPLGIDVTLPRLSWQLLAAMRGQRQSAYQILVASSPELLKSEQGDKWDSGKIVSDETIQIPYAGVPLASRERCYWAVRSWDMSDIATPYSIPATFEMGLLAEDGWQGVWIGADEEMSAPLLRETFLVDKAIAHARVYICGLGYYELSLNGHRIGDHVLDPNWTNFDAREFRDLLYPYDDQTTKRALYVTYDVTEHLQQGTNAVGVMLGNGWHNQRERTVEGKMWYGAPRLLLQLEITYTDGTRATVVSDPHWRCASGPITFNNLFVGEVYDARQEQPGWDSVNYDDRGWNAVRLAPRPIGQLRAQMSPADTVCETLQPVAVTQPTPGMFVFDFGVNFAGWARLHVNGPAGTEVTLRFAEELHPDGARDFTSAGRGQIQEDRYILKGEGDETYTPRFTWHGFRYVEVSGYPGEPGPEALDGLVVHTALESAGTFTCGHPLINRIQEVFRRTLLANYHGCVPSDCPHRERLGYTGDGQLTAEAAMLNYWTPQLYTKWLQDIGDAQNQQTGFVPHTVPFYGGGGGPAWGSAYPIVAWQLYQYYGDRRALETHYAGLAAWVEYLATRTDEAGIVVKEEPGSWCLGDWSLPVSDSLAISSILPPELVNTCYFGLCARLLSSIAAVLGKEADARRYATLRDRIAEDFHRQFFNTEGGYYGTGEYGSDAFALALEAVPVEEQARVVEHMVQNIAAKGGHLDTGILGTPLLLNALVDYGHADVAYAILAKTTFPSFGFMLENGATTLWENWAKINGSHCHPMYGSVSAWFFRELAGICVDPEHPGFKQFVVQPNFVSELPSASASIETIRGVVSSTWQRQDGKTMLEVTVPTGSTAQIVLPMPNVLLEGECEIWRDGSSTGAVPGVNNIVAQDQQVFVTVGGGSYRFVSYADAM